MIQSIQSIPNGIKSKTKSTTQDVCFVIGEVVSSETLDLCHSWEEEMVAALISCHLKKNCLQIIVQ